MPDIEVWNIKDWQKLREYPAYPLRTVVDPTVFRTAELFLMGPTGAADPKRAWMAIERHIGALYLFFDLIMLHDALPVFDFNPSYLREDPWSPQLFAIHPQDSELLVPVHVDGAAADQARDSALTMLEQEPEVDRKVAKSVERALRDLDYVWEPDLRGIGINPGDPGYQVAAFRFGGLLFSQYAQMLSNGHGGAETQGEHVLPPLRSQLYLATSIGKLPRGRLDERRLFAELHSIATNPNARALDAVADVPRIPTFLPYLMSLKPESPRDLLRVAFEERNKPSVRGYREWRMRLAQEAASGEEELAVREIARLADDLKRTLRLSDTPEGPTVSVTVGIPGVIEIGVDGISTGPLRGWVFTHLPGRSHRKLLVRMVRSGRRYVDIALALKQLWSRRPVP